jgi:DNA-binding CsgD family transcriptional regulator
MNPTPPHRRLALASTPPPPGQATRSDHTADVIPLHRHMKKVGDLSDREQQVLELTAEGLTNAEIGKTLFVSEETVKSHLRNLLAKLQARSRAHAVTVGFRHGLLT